MYYEIYGKVGSLTAVLRVTSVGLERSANCLWLISWQVKFLIRQALSSPV